MLLKRALPCGSADGVLCLPFCRNRIVQREPPASSVGFHGYHRGRGWGVGEVENEPRESGYKTHYLHLWSSCPKAWAGVKKENIPLWLSVTPKRNPPWSRFG